MDKKIQTKPPKEVISKLINSFQSGKYEETKMLAVKVSKDFPLNPISWRILGILYLLHGNLNKSLTANHQALKLAPNVPDIHNNLAITLYKLGRYEESIKSSKKAITISNKFVQAYGNLADCLKATGKFQQASIYLKKAIEIDPNKTEYYASLAEVFHKLGNLNNSLLMNEKAIKINQNYYPAYLNIATVLIELEKFKEAEDVYNKIIEIKPDLAIAYYNFANLLKDTSRFEDAISNYYKALKIEPNFADAFYNLGNTFTKVGQFDKANTNYEKAIQIKPNNPKFHSNRLLNLNYNPDLKPKYIYQQHRIFNDQFSTMHFDQNLKKKKLTINKKLRIGYVSPDFRRHSVSYFFEPLIKNHDEDLIESFCYYNNDVYDETTTRLKKYSKNWRSIKDRTDKEVFEIITNDKIDILIDLCGHMAGNRLLVFSLKPAPVQITYLGYPNTTGLSAIDYRFTDEITDPTKNSDRLYSEKLIRIPNCFLCYKGNDNFDIKNKIPVHLNKYITFGSFNNFTKINSKVIKVWSNILRALPNSRIILKNSDFNQDTKFLLNKFNAEGIKKENVLIYNKVENIYDHMNLYNNIDIALDTFPFNGATTTFEALWMGLPVITLSGDTHSSRVSSSILNSLNLKDLITYNFNDYKNVAIKISSDEKYLFQLRRELRDNIKNSPLCDGKYFAREVEKKYFEIFDNK